MSNEQTALAVPTYNQMFADAGITHESIKPFFYKAPGGGVDMTADGIGVVGSAMRISIEDVDIVKETDKFIRFKAWGIDALGNKAFAWLDQMKHRDNGKPWEHYMATGSTRVQRNLRKQLLPMDWLRDAGRMVFGQKVTFTGDLAEDSEASVLQERIDKSIEEYRKLKSENDELKAKVANMEGQDYVDEQVKEMEQGEPEDIL